MAETLWAVPSGLGVGDGSLAAPSIAFLSDTDTGFYRSGSDSMVAVAGGTDLVTFAGSVAVSSGVTFSSDTVDLDGGAIDGVVIGGTTPGDVTAALAKLKAATELTISSGAITVTQSAHTLQPESGTSDDLDTISGTSAGDTGVLRASDNGTDTITLQHGVGNISCFDGADLDLSEGAVYWVSDGTTVYCVGGGSGSGTSAATEAEMEAASATDVYVSPGRQQHHPGTCKAWALFTQDTTTTITESYNVSSITDNGTGDFTINLDESFSTADYVAVGTAGISSGSVDQSAVEFPSDLSRTTSAFRGWTTRVSSGSDRTKYDDSRTSVAAWGEQ